MGSYYEGHVDGTVLQVHTLNDPWRDVSYYLRQGGSHLGAMKVNMQSWLILDGTLHIVDTLIIMVL